ncbi:helix-turn-helix transcriptional regulator [Bradyrhizobium paxllaeri]|uniref:helix-turn-helix transcriptional regulator n=1 Tax=Bradyrhizobium paxllaeri TaxID=190148 RepID=UPI000810564E|nr:AlpA family phage regulatory protein [Bradyrhizobium paxllaeri]
MTERFISVKSVLDRVCLSRTELYERIKQGEFPRTVALGPQKVVFIESQVEAWMKSQIEAGSRGAEWRKWRARNAVAARSDIKVAP